MTRRKSTLDLDWINPADGASIRIRVTRTPDYLVAGTDHIEIESIKPKKAPLPITETGYRSHFLRSEEVTREGGLQSFVTAWLNREAATKEWRKRALAAAQDDLFYWAASQTTAKSKPAKLERPARTPKRRKPLSPGSPR
jgi:hypothetical protein